MACYFELLHRDLTVPWKEKNVPIVVTHFAGECGVGRGVDPARLCWAPQSGRLMEIQDSGVPMAMSPDLKALLGNQH